MTFFKALLIAGAALISITACEKKTVSDCLQDVESFIEERPDSALLVLESFPKESVRNPKTKARLALLLAMALDKNTILLQNMSLRPLFSS